ncbi:MAG: response regulator [Candidatus Eremiobacteraeota bacterium]|nr:response regulator [Candidatus Eremiobacteraeota bacterium]
MVRAYLIEPQSIFVPYLQSMLTRAGFEVVATNHGVDSRDITAHDPAAVFVDIDFLERSGPTALCRIREAAQSAAVIALSEKTDELFSATCVISGAPEVCSKNDGEEKLLRTLRSTVERGMAARKVGR